MKRHWCYFKMDSTWLGFSLVGSEVLKVLVHERRELEQDTGRLLNLTRIAHRCQQPPGTTRGFLRGAPGLSEYDEVSMVAALQMCCETCTSIQTLVSSWRKFLCKAENDPIILHMLQPSV